jgi:AraC-like DNA-binding protein
MQVSRSSHRPRSTVSRVPLASNAVRPWWLCRVNNATQVLAGAIASKEPGAIQRALFAFERRCPEAGTTAERLALRGMIVEIFLRLDAALTDRTASVDRASARQQLHAVPLPAPMERLLAPARSLVTAAQRMRGIPLHERVRAWIDEHPDDPRSIADLATLVGAHPRTLNRHFARHFGTTVQAYRWDRRVACVQQIRATSALKIDDVASAVGAGSKATIYRLLHKRTHSDAGGKLN